MHASGPGHAGVGGVGVVVFVVGVFFEVDGAEQN